MERLLLVVFLSFGPFSFSLTALSNLQETWHAIDSLSFRAEGNKAEENFTKILENFFTQEGISFHRLPYTPSSLIQSFSRGLRVSVLGTSKENAYFVFPLDQLEGSTTHTNKAGIYAALEAIRDFHTTGFPPERNLHFLFLGGEKTREIPVGSLFFLQNSALSFQNSLFYYFEVSNLNQWTLFTRGEQAYYTTPLQQLNTFLMATRLIPSLSFNVTDSFPTKNVFQIHDKEPFETYGSLSLPFLRIISEGDVLSLADIEQDLSRVIWVEFFRSLGEESTAQTTDNTNQYYLYFQFFHWFWLLDSSYYLIFILILANFITFTGFRQVRFVSERVAQTLQFSWYFLFLFFLFFLGLILSSWLIPWLLPVFTETEVSSLIIYFKVGLTIFLNFSFLYLTHVLLGSLPKQTYLYMALFVFLSLGILATFYNVLSSFFFLINGIFVFLGLIASGWIRLIFNFFSFLWLTFIIQEGVDSTWLQYFTSSRPSINLILAAGLFPYLLLLLSYTTPNLKNLRKRFSRSLFLKMQTSLLVTFTFALILALLLNRQPKPIPVVQVTQTWIVGDLQETLSSNTTNLDTSELKAIQEKWHQESLATAPNSLLSQRTAALVTWTQTNFFKRQDYNLQIQFPFDVQSAQITLNSDSLIPPIVYRSNLPYEIDARGNLNFILGPNPPQTLSFSFSLESTSSLSLSLTFDSQKRFKRMRASDSLGVYELIWTQRIVQPATSLNNDSEVNPLDFPLKEDPDIQRIQQLPLPQQRLFQ